MGSGDDGDLESWNAKSLAICTNAVIWLIMLYGRNTTCGAIAVQSSREQKKVSAIFNPPVALLLVDYQPTASLTSLLCASRRSYLEVLTVDGAFRRLFWALSMSKDGGGSDAKILFRATLLKLNNRITHTVVKVWISATLIFGRFTKARNITKDNMIWITLRQM
ncbi:hypothetical protein HAX54_046917 [Datura stramonium]|uniref:Uncharacterized protein n=1 Tax=Datura stramonium TaxID=4076 RepID=A0ABS8SS52_DATST|nr:hypothetical protein [Datura stramonium]